MPIPTNQKLVPVAISTRDFLLSKNLILSDTIEKYGSVSWANGINKPATIGLETDYIKPSLDIIDGALSDRSFQLNKNRFISNTTGLNCSKCGTNFKVNNRQILTFEFERLNEFIDLIKHANFLLVNPIIFSQKSTRDEVVWYFRNGVYDIVESDINQENIILIFYNSIQLKVGAVCCTRTIFKYFYQKTHKSSKLQKK
jgi:hypothetical protein